VVNAALVMVQLALVARLYPASQAADFFVFWTVVWVASVGLRFGFDQLLPKHVAGHAVSGDPAALGGYRHLARYTLPAVALISAPLLVALLPEVSIAAALAGVPIVVLGGGGWAISFLAGALARSLGHAGLSGWTQGPIAIGFAAAAVPVAHAFDDSWLLLGLLSSCALILSALIAMVLVARAVGGERVRAVLIGRGTALSDRDTWPVGAISGVAEVSTVLPVWLASMIGLASADVNGLYAALRVAGTFSWLFGAVVVVATPLIAEALALRRYGRLSDLIRRSAAWGLGVTAPVAVVGLAVAGPLLGLLDPSYEQYGDLLAILIVARLADAATGALAESLMLGGKARWELANQLLATVVLVATGVLLEPALGVIALAIAGALFIVVANLARLVEIRRLFAGEWHSDTPPGRLLPVLPAIPTPRPRAIAVLSALALVFWLRAAGTIGGDGLPMLIAMTAGVAAVVACACWETAAVLGRRWTLVSPVAIAAITWLSLFVLRPFEVYLFPGDTILPLIQLGFGTGDLIRTVALAGLGCATWSLGFLAVVPLLRRQAERPPPLQRPRLSGSMAILLVGFGAVLTLAMFMRQGGLSALISSPGSLHVDRGSGFYGQLGVWVLAGLALYSLAGVLSGSGASARRTLFASAPLAALSTLSLGSRGLVVFALLAAAVVYVRFRKPTLRGVVVTAIAALALAVVLEFSAQVRTQGENNSLATGARRALATPLPAWQTGDLSTYDDLVAMQALIPNSISQMNGRSLVEIPAALAPRALWPGKPPSLDTEVTAYLVPGQTSGSPISMQGELYWNFGLPAIALGGLVLGLLMGSWLFLLFRPEPLALLCYAVLFPATYGLLTRALGTMTANTVISLVGVGAVVVAFGPVAAFLRRLTQGGQIQAEVP
jgi:O-antigen/teichoic acid export membrane protein